MPISSEERSPSPVTENTSIDTPATSSGTSGSMKSLLAKRNPLKGGLSKKQGLAMGGITGIFVSVIAFVVISGPLELIHFAEMLRQYHYSDQSSNNTSEIKKLFNYARGANPSRTRLGFIGNRIADSVTKQFAKNGWSMNYDKTGEFTGYTYDPLSGDNALDPNSTPEQIRAHNEQVASSMNNEGVTATLSGDGKTISVTSSDSRSAGRTVLKFMYSGNRDVGSITAALEQRLLIKRMGINFDPVTELKDLVGAKLADKIKSFNEERTKNLSGDETPPEVTVQGEKDSKGKPVTTNDQGASNANDNVDNVRSGKLSAKDLLNKGGSTLLGVLCAAQGIFDAASKASKINKLIPLIHAGAEVLSVASKIKDGNNVDLNAVGQISKSLESSTGGGSFIESNSLQYELKGGVGKKLPSELDPRNSELLGSKILNDVPGLSGACSILNNSFVSLALTIAGGVGGILTATVTEVITKSGLMNDIVNALTTKVVDLSAPKYAGAAYGEAANVGVQLMSNETAATMGGRVLTNSETVALNDQINQETNAQNKIRSIASKYLDPTQYDTPVAKVLDSINPRTLVASLSRLPGMVFASLFQPFMGKSSAATEDYTSTYYGYSKVGFAPGELDSTGSDPYQNADEVKDIINNDRSYIQKIQDCFNVTVSGYDSSGLLDFTSQSGSGTQPVILGNGDYSNLPSYCTSTTDSNMVKIRVAMFDTFALKSTACTDFGDSQSCSDLGLQGQ